MTGRCVEGFITGVAVGIGGAFLGGIAYFVLTRNSRKAAKPRNPSKASALEAAPNPTFPLEWYHSHSSNGLRA